MKKIILLVSIISLVGVISFGLHISDNKTIIKNEIFYNYTNCSDAISMMLETDEDSGIYEVSQDSSWPDVSLYTFNETLSKCVNGSTLEWDETSNLVLFSGISTDKCYLYFDVYVEPSYTISEILATKTISSRDDFSVAFTQDTTGVVYQTIDNDGYTYYWAGDATDNYVYFAGFYWRIVRVNGDDTLRIIYDGTEAHENGEASSDRYISGFYSSSSYVNMSYFGNTFYYDLNIIYYSNGSDYESLKYRLDKWYSSYLADTEYEDYVYQSGKFCNDVEVYSDDSATSLGTYKYAITYYPNYRMTNYTPSLECSNEDDVYNIGTLSADEVMYAGGTYEISNTNYYLYIGYDYWTMSPSQVISTLAYVYIYGVGSTGNIKSIGGTNSGSYAYAKAVINLNSDILLKGDGTIDNPYEIVGT